MMNTQHRKNTVSIFLTIAAMVVSLGCKKMVEVAPPSTSQNGANVFEDDATAIAVLTGQYADLAEPSENVLFGATLNLGLAADELAVGGNANAGFITFYKNVYNPVDITGWVPWDNLYQFVFTANSTIEGLNRSNKITPAVKKQLLGEQHFLRAFYYFLLTNVYGDVPLALTSDYKVNAVLKRAPQALVYNQIISDLLFSRANLSTNFVGINVIGSTIERVRPTKWVADALLAKAYLYARRYAEAEDMASEVIAKTSLFDIVTLAEVFQKNNKEAIWQLQTTLTPQHTLEARTFVYPSAGADDTHPFYLNPSLVAAFETGDHRKDSWLRSWTNAMVTPAQNYYYPFKYKNAFDNDPENEYTTVFRLAEQYLIRAEARIKNGKFNDAKDDLDVIRKRAGLGVYTGSIDALSMEIAVLRERRVELFTEFGNRWFDLIRTGNINTVMQTAAIAKGSTWQPHKSYLPLRVSEVQSGINLTQTPGY